MMMLKELEILFAIKLSTLHTAHEHCCYWLAFLSALICIMLLFAALVTSYAGPVTWPIAFLCLPVVCKSDFRISCIIINICKWYTITGRPHLAHKIPWLLLPIGEKMICSSNCRRIIILTKQKVILQVLDRTSGQHLVGKQWQQGTAPGHPFLIPLS